MPGRNPIAIEAIDHIVLRVADVARAMRFYCDVLGCVPERMVAEMGLHQLRAGRALIDLVDLAGPLGRAGGAGPGAEGRNVDHVALELARFDEPLIRSHLRLHGIEAGETARRYGADGYGPSIYIRDPDGNTVELKGPAEEAP